MAGVYLHIPFCLRKCDYCDFFSIPIARGEAPQQAYGTAIAAQLRRDAALLAGQRVETIYFGGGTPSLMPPAFFAAILADLRCYLDVAPDAEVSCEVNPATTEAAWFAAVREAGITRVSIGVQTFRPHLLEALGRLHTADEAMEAIAAAQDAGFASVSLDLMHAIPGETMADVEEDLRTAMTFQPEHLSVYALTIEEGTPLALRHSERSEESPASEGILHFVQDDMLELQQLRVVARMLARGNWSRYEISSFAKPGFACRHNLNYWRYGEYLGLGAGATSFVGRRRFTQVRDVAAYLGITGALAEDEAIDARTAMGEFCFLGLRTVEGISRRRFAEFFGARLDDAFGREIGELVDDGLLMGDGDRLALTATGFELANQAFARFVG